MMDLLIILFYIAMIVLGIILVVSTVAAVVFLILTIYKMIKGEIDLD